MVAGVVIFMQSKTTSFRSDINGVRAIAVIAVVFYHFGVSGFSGGFTGVDIFFVISGFLMTGIIFRKIDLGVFSIVGFYVSRAKRIIPALAALCLFLLAAGWFVLMPGEYKELGKHAASSIGFFSNFVYLNEVGYFDTSALEKWLLHTWSLSVEWQFYLAYPIIILALHRAFGFSATRVLLAALAIGSFALCVFSGVGRPGDAFYMLPARAWEMIAGGIVYLYPVNTSTMQKKVLSIIGLLIIALGALFFTKENVWPGWLTLIPVAGTVFLLYAANQTMMVTNNRVFGWVGEASYSIYLWHWPIVVLIGYCGWSDKTGALAGGIAVSLAFGFFSTVAIERPLRNLRVQMPDGWYLIGYVGLILLVSAFGALAFYKNGFPGRAAVAGREAFAQYFENSAPGWAYFKKHKIPEKYRYDCDFYNMDSYFSGVPTNEPRGSISPVCYTPTAKSVVMVWGDSHAQQLLYGLEHNLPHSVSLLQVTSSGCAANIPDPNKPGIKYCDHSNTFALEVIKKVAPQVLVIAQMENHDVSNDLAALVARAKADGVKRVIVVGPVPRYTAALYKLVLRNYWFNMPKRIKDNFASDIFLADSALKARASIAGFEYISALDVFCNSEGCITYLGEDPKTGLVTFDYGHLTSEASGFFAKAALVPAIVKDISAIGEGSGAQ
jgi:peptidoglycan/LPS O-acetylase OafA/YrhL